MTNVRKLYAKIVTEAQEKERLRIEKGFLDQEEERLAKIFRKRAKEDYDTVVTGGKHEN